MQDIKSLPQEDLENSIYSFEIKSNPKFNEKAYPEGDPQTVTIQFQISKSFENSVQ